jgi:hypothetical protein
VRPRWSGCSETDSEITPTSDENEIITIR